jgi:hypothetical protein
MYICGKSVDADVPPYPRVYYRWVYLFGGGISVVEI